MGADASLAFILNKIDNFVSNEWSLRESNEDGINLLRSDHESITGDLRGVDAYTEHDDQNRAWIKQLRDIKHEIENVVSMYEYRNAEKNAKPWYRSGKIVLKDHSIANAIPKIQERLRNVKEYREASRVSLGSHQASPSTDHHDAAGIAPLYIPETDMIGVEGPRKDLASWVLDVVRAHRVMFVVGMGGSGKTALVKVVYEQLKEDFDCHVWLSASMFEKMEMEHLLSALCSKLFSPTRGQSFLNSSKEDLIDMLRNYLQHKRYLIVLDNWKINDWESMKCAFPEGCISRVMITTRREDLASLCSHDSSVDIYKIPPLPCEKARELFCRKAFSTSGGVYPSVPGLPQASERLLRECEGLPLGVIKMGEVLSRGQISRSGVEDMANNLRGELKLKSGQLSGITTVLLSSYNELPYHLKLCFLYMIMFTKECPVKRGMLIRLWMAEDFIIRENGKEAEDIGEEYLKVLMGRNLIQGEMGFDGKPRAYRVHSLMHKIALSIAETESFCTIGVDIQEKQKLQRLSIQNSELNGLNKDLHHLRTLFVSGSCMNSPEDKRKIPIIPPGTIPSMKYLKILHLDNTKVDSLPNGVKELLLLKYLSLCNTDIKQIPISTERLKFLETLNLKQTFVTVLPNSLVHLEKLRYLVACRIDPHDLHEVRGFKAPRGISKLTNLQKLSYVRAERDHELIKELQYLTKLRKLGIVNLPSDSGPLLCITMQKLTRLRSLSMASETETNQLPDTEYINKPPTLQRLYLWGRLQKMPRWISNLDELVRIHLKWSKLGDSNNPITVLGELPNLLELQLLDAYTGNQLVFHAGTFLKLKSLELDRMEQLQMIIIENGALSLIKKLTISLCKNLREIINIDSITQLKDLHLRGMTPNFVNQLKRNGTLQQLVQRVNISSMQLQNGRWVQEALS